MRVLLIYPINRDFMPPSVFPLGVAYIASVLVANGHSVDVVDMNVEREEGDLKLEHALAEGTYDWIGISSIITQYKRVKALAKQIKELAPEIPLIMGGPGPTSHPSMYIKYAQADVVVVGEGELTVLELGQRLMAKDGLEDCPGLCLRHNGEIVLTPCRPPIQDLDSLPFPAWGLFQLIPYMENFLFKSPEIERGINVMTSRGCSAKCTYCMRNFGNKVRFRSVENMIKEMTMLHHRYGVDHIHFIDDTIASNKNRLGALAEGIRDSGMSITWSANAKVTQVTSHLLKKMAESGCVQLAYGIESADSKILKEMKKGITPERASTAIQWTRDAGIDVKAYFMIGFPSEDESTIRSSVDFCKRHLVGGEFFFLTPFPGTEVYEDALKKGLIKNEDVYLEVAGEVRNFVVNCTKSLDNETLFTLKEQAEAEIQEHLKKHCITFNPSIREDPRKTAKNLPDF